MSNMESEDYIKSLSEIPKTFKFGNIDVFPNIFMSPMMGVTGLAFREIISRISNHNIGLCVSEFISVEAMTRSIPKAIKQMKFSENQRPFVIQIYGGDGNSMAEGAIMAEASGADALEINCGCPAPKVVRKGGGSDLLKDACRFQEVVYKVVKSVSIPVSVKVRLGYTDSTINVKETFRMAAGEGAQMFVIHGRTRSQGYRGFANWDLIEDVAREATIPVIGNGDILTWKDVIHRIKTRGVAGVSIGRGVLHNPWIFKQIIDVYQGRKPVDPIGKDYIKFFEDYRDLLFQEMNFESAVLGRMKQLAARIMKGFRNSAIMRRKLLHSETLTEYFDHIYLFYMGLPSKLERDFSKIFELNGRTENKVSFGVEYQNN